MSDEARPIRVCDVCGQVDDHPRHTFGAASGTFRVNQGALASVLSTDMAIMDQVRLITEISDTSTQYRHMDCCAQAGCPDGSCTAIIGEVKGAQGDALVKKLTSGAFNSLGSQITKNRMEVN